MAARSCGTSSGKGKEQMNTNDNECSVLESLSCADPCQLSFLIISLNSHILLIFPVLTGQALRQTKVMLLPHRYMLVSGRVSELNPSTLAFIIFRKLLLFGEY